MLGDNQKHDGASSKLRREFTKKSVAGGVLSEADKINEQQLILAERFLMTSSKPLSLSLLTINFSDDIHEYVKELVASLNF